MINAEQNRSQVTEVQYKERPAPYYPRRQVQAGRGGAVEISYLVDKDGRPHDLVVLRSSHPDFEQPSLRAVKKYVLENPQDINVRQHIVVHFQIENMFNSVSRKFIRRYEKVSTLLSDPQASEDKLDRAFNRLKTHSARSRCEQALAYMLQSQYDGKFKSVDQQIETLRMMQIFDRESKPEHLCLNNEQLRYAKANLLMALQESKYYGELMREFDAVTNLRLPELENAFSSVMQTLTSRPEEVLPVSREITVSERGYSVVELYSSVFSVETEQGELGKVNLRCDAGYFSLDIKGDKPHVVPDKFGACELQLLGKPGSRFILNELPEGL